MKTAAKHKKIMFLQKREVIHMSHYSFWFNYFFILQMWVDDFLHWNPADYNYAWRIIVHTDEIWLPELNLIKR